LDAGGGGGAAAAGASGSGGKDEEMAGAVEQEGIVARGEQQEEDGEREGKGKKGSGWGLEMDVDQASGPAESVNPFAAMVTTTQTQEEPGRPASPLKRKSEAFETDAGKPPKRVDTGKGTAAQVQVAVMPKAQAVQEKGEEESGEESDSEGSVQIDMTLDDDEEEEEEEEDDE
jgi:hypothetical protein